MAKPTEQMPLLGLDEEPQRCEARGCRATAQPVLVRIGSRGFRTSLCEHHRFELELAMRDQAKDWGRSRKPEGWNARFHYGARRGYHSY